jgi:histidinol dehydrogenase
MYVGRIAEISSVERARFFDRGTSAAVDVGAAVTRIIDDVRERGDDALRALALAYDGVRLQDLEVPRAEWDRALRELDDGVKCALEEAATAIRSFHQAQMPEDIEMETRPGVRLGRRAQPLDRVGVYAPGGKAAYPSSILMGVVPARVAGVDEIIVCTPPGPDGKPTGVVLAACAIAGAERVFAVGGAGAIAALAYGTSSIPSVARIVGPGNAYVAEAKRQVNGTVSIDSPAGPSEVLIIADATADAALVAAEMAAQAEHDPDAAAVAVLIAGPDGSTDTRMSADAVLRALEQTVAAEERSDIIEAALASRGAILTADSLDEALAFAQDYAPEHLSLMIDDARACLPRVRNAGTIFIGHASSVAFGDYMTGANHVLPTNRLARSFSGLSTLDFLRFVTYQDMTPEAAAAMAEPTRLLATAEGLPAHARAARLRASSAAVPARTSVPRRMLRVRDAYRDIELYEPGRTPCETDLSDNTNLNGVPPAARAVLDAPAAALVTRYPTVYAREMKAAIAARHGVRPENVVTGCGSDDILDSMIRAFAAPRDVVAFPTPTFGVVSLFARMNAADPVAIPHGADLQLDTEALIAANAAVTYVCNPNNPTGTLYTRASIERVAQGVDGVLAIDEAYADYADMSAIDLAMSSNRVVVVRTLSKAFGLAGLRIGYAIAAPDLVREIEKSRGPYKVGGVAEAAAIAALRDDAAWVASHIRETCENRRRLACILPDIGFASIPSSSNFLLIPLRGRPGGGDTVEIGRASALAARLRDAGVAVRPFDALPGIGDAIRVTVGPWPLMERFVNALRAVGSDFYADQHASAGR